MVRVKWRYILTEVVTGLKHAQAKDSSISEALVLDCVKKSIRTLHGEAGLAAILGGLKVKYINVKTRTVLIRVYRESCQKLLQALTVVNAIGNNRAFFSTIHVSGTIRSCYKYLHGLVVHFYNRVLVKKYIHVGCIFLKDM